MTIGLIDQDPTYGLEHALEKYKKGHFASITLEELPKFIFDLHNFKARTTRQTFLAIRLMFLTFTRTSELIKAEWTEIDFDDAMWSIPGKRMKKDCPHLVPLSRQAIEVLSELRNLNPYSEFLFPSIPKPKSHEQRDNPYGFKTYGLQESYDRPWLPIIGNGNFKREARLRS